MLACENFNLAWYVNVHDTQIFWRKVRWPTARSKYSGTVNALTLLYATVTRQISSYLMSVCSALHPHLPLVFKPIHSHTHTPWPMVICLSACGFHGSDAATWLQVLNVDLDGREKRACICEIASACTPQPWGGRMPNLRATVLLKCLFPMSGELGPFSATKN